MMKLKENFLIESRGHLRDYVSCNAGFMHIILFIDNMKSRKLLCELSNGIFIDFHHDQTKLDLIR